MKINLLWILILVMIDTGSSQVTQEWVQRYNGSANSYDIVNKLLPDQTGNIYVYGTSNETDQGIDLRILKYNSMGALLWSYSYNGSSNSFDQLTDAILDQQGNSYITGTAIENDTVQIVFIKVSPAGSMIWNRSFKGHNTSSVSGRSISIYGENTLSLFWSERDNIANKFKSRISYFNASGQLLSEIQIQEPIINTGGAVKILYDGSGQTITGMNVLDTTTNHTVPTVYNADQNWYRRITGTSNDSHSFVDLAIDNDNNVVALALVVNNGSGQDFRTVKYSQDGTLLWQKDFNGAQSRDDYPYSLKTDAQNNIYVTGLSRSGEPGTEDAVTIKYDANGNTKWTKLYNGIGNGADQGITLCVDNDKNVYMGGATDLGGIKLGFLTVKYDSLGNQIWDKTYNFSSTSPEDFIYSMAVNTNHEVYITGISFSNTSDYDFATIKYSQPIGIQNITKTIPEKFSLSQNYPNPFNPSTNIRFQIANSGNVKLSVYNILGKEIEILFNGQLNPGTYLVNWEASAFPSGIYYYKIMAGNYSETRKMILLK